MPEQNSSSTISSQQNDTKKKMYYIYDQYGDNVMEPLGPIGLIPIRGAEEMAQQVNAQLYARRLEYLKYARQAQHIHPAFLREDYTIPIDSSRYTTGEGRVVLKQAVRGHDIFILADLLNHSCHYQLFGRQKYMTPDEHYQDLKRVILAISGKARRINVIIPFLFDSRQHHRNGRESLECAFSLEELHTMGVSNIITFDAHDPRVSNAIPISGFENIQTAYQIIKALKREIPDLKRGSGKLMVISPDEGALPRSMYFANMLGAPLGTFYKRRDYTRVVNGRNPILKHEFLGDSADGKDVLVIDDLIASGESMLDICREMKKLNARNVYCAASYGLFTNGIAEFNKAYEEGYLKKIFTTNLIYRSDELKSAAWYEEVNMSKFTALLIDAINHDASLSLLSTPTQKILDFLQR